MKHYGGWRAGAYQADPGDFTSVAISQAWEKRDGFGCTEDVGTGAWDPYRSSPYYPTAARRANLVVPEIGVLKWFLEIRKNGSVNLEINGRF